MIAAMATMTTAGLRRPASVTDWDFEMAVAGICGSRRGRGAAADGASLSTATFPAARCAERSPPTLFGAGGSGEPQSRPHPGAAFFSYQRGWPTGLRGLLSRGTVKQEQARLPDGRRACSGFVAPAYFPRFKRKTVGEAHGGHRRGWKRA